MSELKGIVLSHAALASGMVDAVKQITGDSGGLVPVSNDGCDSGELGKRLAAAIDGSNAVVFVDLPGGSCLQAAMRHMKSGAQVAVVAGVNLAMLLDFVYHRSQTPAEAARRAAEHGVKAVRALPA